VYHECFAESFCHSGRTQCVEEYFKATTVQQMSDIRVVVFDDNPRVRDAMSMLLGSTPGIEFVAAYGHCNNLEYDLRESRPDVILLDIDMPGMDGIQAIDGIRKYKPGTKVLMQTVFDDHDRIFAAICAGAHGYILKNTPPARIIESIQEVYHGGAPMTPNVANKVLKLLASFKPNNGADQAYDISEREREVLKMLVDGKPYKVIAADLGITYDTVRFHIRNIYEKLHVSSMTEAVVKAIRDRIV
jgi:DNA-binding NarL/FixJ family response regulator